MSSLTIAYITNRRQPRLQWFLDSLALQRRETGIPVDRLLVVSHFPQTDVDGGRQLPSGCTWVAPKPCVWAGPHRLTREDWFAAGNARNTALCFAPDGWIAYVDDLSVLEPGWLAAVAEAMEHPGVVTLGAYQKVKDLFVECGRIIVTAYTKYPGGIDSRMKQVGSTPRAHNAAGQWLYGCSLVVETEALLKINGWCEDLCGGLGFEDCLTGVVLENNGIKFRYDTRMMTLESEEDHHVEPAFRKSDFGVSPNDKSNKALEIARTLKRFDNHFDLRAVRASTGLASPRPEWGPDSHGASFPIPTGPATEWYTGRPLSEL